jgi:hypothetical protein
MGVFDAASGIDGPAAQGVPVLAFLVVFLSFFFVS